MCQCVSNGCQKPNKFTPFLLFFFFFLRHQSVTWQQHIWGSVSSAWGKISEINTAVIYCQSWCSSVLYPNAVAFKLFIALFSSLNKNSKLCFIGKLQKQTSDKDSRRPEPQTPSVWKMGPLGNLVQISAFRPHSVRHFILKFMHLLWLNCFKADYFLYNKYSVLICPPWCYSV